MTWTHEFHEQGNGFPGVGEDVIEADGGDIRLLTVREISSIQTRQWHANWVYLVCEDSESDWDSYSERKQDRLYQEMHHVSPISEDDE